MGLFSKKDPCVICGGKVSGLFPWKIEGQYVCDDCHGDIDMQDSSELTLDQFCAYRDFREQNSALKQQFKLSYEADFGLFDTKMVFDFDHRLFCMDKNLNKTVFHGSELKSFIIKEDSMPLFEGSAAGFIRHQSTVPGRIMAMAPQITQFVMQQQMQRQLEQMNKDDDNVRRQSCFTNIPEPFKKFNVELRFDHPYWSEIDCDMGGPMFDNNNPNAAEYMRDYDRDVNKMMELARALMTVAFPNARNLSAGAAAESAAPATRAAAPQAAATTDVAAELRKYKDLMEDGIITPGEFEAKKKQLLGL